MRLEVRFFNSMRRHSGGALKRLLELNDRPTVLDVVRSLRIPPKDVHLVFHNGRVVGHSVEETGELLIGQGDVLGLSGPVPFSRGYGSPVV